MDEPTVGLDPAGRRDLIRVVNNVREEMLHFFQRNKEVADKILAKVEDSRQLRKELQDVKKLARDRAKAITIRIPQLKDCKVHYDKSKGKGKGSMVFLTEGQSAAGSITAKSTLIFLSLG